MMLVEPEFVFNGEDARYVVRFSRADNQVRVTGHFAAGEEASIIYDNQANAFASSALAEQFVARFREDLDGARSTHARRVPR